MTTASTKDSPTTPQLRFGVAQERELARSDREFKLYMETLELIHLTAMTGAMQSKRSPFEFTDAITLALVLTATRQCAMGAVARGVGTPFPRERLFQLLAECITQVEVEMAQVERVMDGSKKDH